MIDLTPLDVRKKKGDFRRGLRGYDAVHVDDFLDIVADRLEKLVRENLALKERIARFENEMADHRDREKTLTEALVAAQEMREEVRAQSAREADVARREAERDAVRIRAEAQQLRTREEALLRRLRGRQLEYLQTYRSFLERELTELAAVARGLEMNGAMGDVFLASGGLTGSRDADDPGAAGAAALAETPPGGSTAEQPSTEEWATPAQPPLGLAAAVSSEPELILSDDDVLADGDVVAEHDGAAAGALPEPDEDDAVATLDADDAADAADAADDVDDDDVVRPAIDVQPADRVEPGAPDAERSASKRNEVGDDTDNLLRSLFGDDH